MSVRRRSRSSQSSTRSAPGWRWRFSKPMRRCPSWVSVAACGSLLAATSAALADEGGTSFWAPGQFSSLAAVPGEPGWAFPVFYYGVSASAAASKKFLIGGDLALGIDATGDLLFFFPTYTF